MTNGKKISISSTINNHNLDSIVGLALHEGAHCIYTDFFVLKKIANRLLETNLMGGRRWIELLLNFIEDKYLPYFYLHSFALVMPALIGPTNIPPWEAFKMEVPVIYSESDSIKETLGDAVYYVNPLEPESIRKYTTLHPRCGTAFLLLVVLVAILVFIALGHPPLWIRVISRIVLIPVIAGLAYEILKFHGAHSENRILKSLLAPGLMLQMLTTKRPDDGQIEVAITALNGAIAADKAQEDSIAN